MQNKSKMKQFSLISGILIFLIVGFLFFSNIPGKTLSDDELNNIAVVWDEVDFYNSSIERISGVELRILFTNESTYHTFIFSDRILKNISNFGTIKNVDSDSYAAYTYLNLTDGENYIIDGKRFAYTDVSGKWRSFVHIKNAHVPSGIWETKTGLVSFIAIIIFALSFSMMALYFVE